VETQRAALLEERRVRREEEKRTRGPRTKGVLFKWVDREKEICVNADLPEKVPDGKEEKERTLKEEQDRKRREAANKVFVPAPIPKVSAWGSGPPKNLLEKEAPPPPPAAKPQHPAVNTSPKATLKSSSAKPSSSSSAASNSSTASNPPPKKAATLPQNKNSKKNAVPKKVNNPPSTTSPVPSPQMTQQVPVNPPTSDEVNDVLNAPTIPTDASPLFVSDSSPKQSRILTGAMTSPVQKSVEVRVFAASCSHPSFMLLYTISHHFATRPLSKSSRATLT